MHVDVQIVDLQQRRSPTVDTKRSVSFARTEQGMWWHADGLEMLSKNLVEVIGYLEGSTLPLSTSMQSGAESGTR